MVRAAGLVMLFVAAAATVTGCSQEPSRYAATGTVTIDGKPAPFVVVRLHPVEEGSQYGGTGTTDDAGKFKVGEDGKNTGFPAGDYKVTFSQTLVKGKPTLAGSGGKAAEKEATEKEGVADDYRTAKDTPVKATIGRGSNSFTFDIKPKK